MRHGSGVTIIILCAAPTAFVLPFDLSKKHSPNASRVDVQVLWPKEVTAAVDCLLQPVGVVEKCKQEWLVEVGNYKA